MLWHFLFAYTRVYVCFCAMSATRFIVRNKVPLNWHIDGVQILMWSGVIQLKRAHKRSPHLECELYGKMIWKLMENKWKLCNSHTGLHTKVIGSTETTRNARNYILCPHFAHYVLYKISGRKYIWCSWNALNKILLSVSHYWNEIVITCWCESPPIYIYKFIWIFVRITFAYHSFIHLIVSVGC